MKEILKEKTLMLANFPTGGIMSLPATTSPGWLRVSAYWNPTSRVATPAQLSFVDGITGNPVTLPLSLSETSGIASGSLGVYAGAGTVTLEGNGNNFWVEIEQPS